MRLFRFFDRFRWPPEGGWTFEHYSLDMRRNGGEDVETPPAEAWAARIKGWYFPIGLGASPEEAKANLRKEFEKHVAGGGETVAPGREMPIRFESTERIEAHGGRAYELIEELFGITPFFVSDGTDLWTFAEDEESEARAREILRERYGVTLEPGENPLLPDLLNRIAGW